MEDRAGDVSKLEWRIRFSNTEFSEPDQPADGIGIRDPRESEIRLKLVPSPGACESFASATDLVIGSSQLVPDRAIELRSAKSVRRMPGQRERKAGVADRRRIDNDILSEAALVSLLLLDACRKYAPPVPVAILVLTQMHDRMIGLEIAEKNSAVEKVAWIVRNSDRSRG